MNTKRFCFAFNHLSYSNGVARSLIGIANHICMKENVEVTLRPVFCCDQNALDLLNKKIIIRPVFGFYFPGMSRIVSFLPKRFLHDIIYGCNKYDVEVGFQHGVSTKAVVSGKKSKAKRYIWIHGYDDKLSLKRFYAKADKIICVSKHNQNKLRAAMESPLAIECCYNPLDDRSIVTLGCEGIDIQRTSKLLFSTVGRLSVEKGYVRLVRVAQKLIAEGYQFQLWIIGDGPEYNNIQNEINRLNLKNNVIMLGSQKNPHKYTSKSDVFVCSSYSEGYSTACTEAVILGIPVLTTNISGGEEIVKDSKAGMLVGCSDNDLYFGLKYILDNPEVIGKWKEQLMTSKEVFSYRNRVKMIEKVLEL